MKAIYSYLLPMLLFVSLYASYELFRLVWSYNQTYGNPHLAWMGGWPWTELGLITLGFVGQIWAVIVLIRLSGNKT